MKKIRRGMCLLLGAIVALTGIPVTENTKVQAAANSYIVYLDPGHGGGETGARSTHNGITYKEEEINWKISQYTKQALSSYSNIKVYMTRGYNDWMSITGRVNKAYLGNADLLVSQHNNSSSSKSPNGASVMISRGTYRKTIHSKSKAFGSYVMNELGNLGLYRRFPETGGMEYRMSENNSKYPNGAARDYYGIVAESVENNLVGVIIEHAFVSNPNDARNFLRTDAQLKKLGQADARAIVKYLNAYGGGSSPKPTPTPTPKPTQTPTATPTPSVSAKWIQKNGLWYYRKSNGTYAKGFLSLGKKKYYLNSSGVMQIGWEKIGSYWYYFNKDGSMKTGWLVEGSQRYYLVSNGRMFRGLKTINGRTYYFTPKQTGKYKMGARITGWKQVSGKWYYFTADGACKGWRKIGSKWYYMDSTGVMKTGWIRSKGKMYYLKKSPSSQCGQMLSSTTMKIGNKTYRFDASGACTNY